MQDSTLLNHYSLSVVYRLHYLWHLLGDYVHMVSRCDIFLTLRARVSSLPLPALLFLLLFLFLLLVCFLLLPTLLLQLQVLVRHGHPWERGKSMTVENYK